MGHGQWTVGGKCLVWNREVCDEGYDEGPGARGSEGVVVWY